MDEIGILELFPEDKPLPLCGLVITVGLVRNGQLWSVQVSIDSEEIKGKTLAEIGAGLQRSVYTAAHAVVTYAHKETGGFKDVNPEGN